MIGIERVLDKVDSGGLLLQHWAAQIASLRWVLLGWGAWSCLRRAVRGDDN